MKIITTILAIMLGVGAMVYAFMNNASPYVTIQEAKMSKGDRMHLAGDILKETLKTDAANNLVRFQLRDSEGQTCQVVYHGPPPANMGEATQVVAVGQMKDGDFVSNKLLVKCPSRYESKANGS